LTGAPAGAAEWSAMSAVQKAPWKRLSDESARHYKQQKAIKDGRVVRYYLSDAAMEAVARRKKRTASVATAKTKASSKAKAKSVKKSTTGVKVCNAYIRAVVISKIGIAV